MPNVRKRKFGDVVAERRLETVDGRKRVVVVSLGKPRLPRGQQDWECPFRIKGAGLNIVEYGCGVDAMQALMTALEGIRAMLDETGRPLSWKDGLPDGTGFQRFIPIALGSPLARRLEGLVDREITRYVERLQKRRADKRR